MEIRIFLTLIGTILVVSSLLIVLISWSFAKWWCNPKKILPERTPDAYQLPFEPVTFKSHGIKLSGWFIPVNGNNNLQKVVIVTHGWSGNSSNMLKIAKVLHKANFIVFMFDFRGHGASEKNGPITIRKFAEDIISSIDYLETRNITKESIFILGHSMGASGSILAASIDHRIQALISCSAFSSPSEITWAAMKKFHLYFWPLPFFVSFFIECWIKTSMKNVTPKIQIEKIRVPMLLVHGSDDTYISSKNLEELYKNARPDYGHRLIISGKNHYDIRNDTRLHEGIVQFLEKQNA